MANEPQKAKLSSYSTAKNRLPSFNRPNLPSGWLGRRLAAALASLLIIFGVGFGGGWLGSYVYNHGRPAASSTAAKQQRISDESQLIASIAKTVGPSVVSIDVQSQVTTPDFFGFAQTQQQAAAGTGFIIDSSGIIITNRHVVPAGTSKLSVTLADGTTLDDVSVIGRTSDSNPLDAAFLKVNNAKGHKLTAVTIGDSSKMQVGDRVIAIGNALGQFQNTVTSGIISGFGRDVTAGDTSGSAVETLTDLFQTDAAINEGNSGGPLVNINGEVIGLNTAIASGAQNIGFSIPINDVKGLIASVLNKGKLEQPYLGVRYVSLTDDVAAQLNLSVKRGAYIVPSTDGSPSVISGSPADKAGLKEKDIITKLNNISIDDKTSLTGALNKQKVGDQVNLTVVRDGKTISVSATIDSAPTQ